MSLPVRNVGELGEVSIRKPDKILPHSCAVGLKVSGAE
jgi:hypothetical protein